jgi:FAD/FMN-containing dehydrogenase
MSEFPNFQTVGMLDGATIRKFAAGLTGHVIMPTDVSYESARWSWNRAVDRHPEMIVQCATTDDVLSAVDFASNHNLLLAVRSGGHSFAGHSTCDGGMVIDFSAMKDIHVDPSTRVARAQAGVKVGQFDRGTQAFALATVMGGCEDVGIGRLTLGGGQGLLSSHYGLACDNLLSAEVVTADGRLLVASAQENEDLFWGIRGGAGNFGIAIMLQYRLHPISKILGGAVVYPVERVHQILRSWNDYTGDLPDELTTVFGVGMTSGGPVIGILACWCGDLKQGEEALRPLFEPCVNNRNSWLLKCLKEGALRGV